MIIPFHYPKYIRDDDHELTAAVWYGYQHCEREGFMDVCSWFGVTFVNLKEVN